MTNKRMLAFGVIGVILLAGVIQYQRTGSQLEQLQASGFQVDLRAEFSPLLVIDRHRREGALVYPDHYQRFRLSQIAELAWIPMAGPARDPYPELLIRFDGLPTNQLRIADREGRLRPFYDALRPLIQAE